jgi:pimeloyl-ACP methyl ester carboxylesterase
MRSLSARTGRFERRAVVIEFSEESAFVETYGFTGSQGRVVLEGNLLVPTGSPSKTLYVFMHPSSTLNVLPMPTACAGAGLHVLCAASRYPKNDSALIMEKVAADMAAWVRWAREEAAYERVVLVGWSGGGSLSLFYQAQAQAPTITHTPAGDPYDLTRLGLQPADGIIFIAAHLSRAETLTEWMDPSVIDESDPDHRHRELDIYDPACPNRPPFTDQFIAAFRAAQIDRNRRITAWVRDTLEALQRSGTAEKERAFCVHRTMADPRWIDPTIDPNDRRPNWCYLGDPRAVNVGPVGLARFSTLRSWLSQWSYDLSNVNGAHNARRITHTPVLQIVNSADDAAPASHGPIIRDALATRDKEYRVISGATHYYLGQPQQLQECIDVVRDWSCRKGLLEA